MTLSSGGEKGQAASHPFPAFLSITRQNTDTEECGPPKHGPYILYYIILRKSYSYVLQAASTANMLHLYIHMYAHVYVYTPTKLAKHVSRTHKHYIRIYHICPNRGPGLYIVSAILPRPQTQARLLRIL